VKRWIEHTQAYGREYGVRASWFRVVLRHVWFADGVSRWSLVWRIGPVEGIRTFVEAEW